MNTTLSVPPAALPVDARAPSALASTSPAGDAAWRVMTLEADGLSWRVAAAGAGETVLLLHGTGASLESWQACAGLLARSCRVIVPDLPGHASTGLWADGRSSLPRMARAVEALLSAMQVRPVLVVGHSAGAALALQWALSQRVHGCAPQPLRAVVSVNGALQPLPGWSAQVFPALAWGLSRSRLLVSMAAWHARDREAVRRLIAATGSALPPARVAHYQALLRSPAHVSGVLAMMAGWRLDALVQAVPGLPLPIHLVTGLKDRTVPPRQARELAARWPQARLTEQPGLGHLLHEEDPAWMAGQIRQHLGATAW